ncbi:SurA N- domain family [Sulfurihydrogenibium azorense Az-Fu1]|uniref:SurA N-domain family n=1 Tax=Sulfurihydrogenibium azorense (strain DSM 15241 / OCM 825 / Az-Fu1) TaxID=204536 RepID=C1DTF7_SULAA|nr:peptidylprolyl isomerase [Sulfurihydrogenibium azorense]ACN99753.1 SurA N- domain family [Sulfurihydrogenibium azorense Az-Fu1]
MKKVSFIFIFVLTVLGFVKAENLEGYQLFDKIVLVVNGEPVLKSDVEFAKEWYKIKDDKQAQEKIIDSILLSQQARKLGISVSPKEVDNALLSIAKANNIQDLETFKKELEKNGISYTKLKEFITRDLVSNKFLHFYLRDYITKGIVEGSVEDVKKIRMIYISKDRPDYESVVKLLKEKLNKNNFSEYAAKYSDDKFTAENAGLLGEVKKGDLAEELDKEVFSRKEGDIFQVDTKEGTYFIYIEKEEKKLIPKENLTEKDMEKLKREYDMYLKKLREKAVIQRFE